jgi:hypothetical protein
MADNPLAPGQALVKDSRMSVSVLHAHNTLRAFLSFIELRLIGILNPDEVIVTAVPLKELFECVRFRKRMCHKTLTVLGPLVEFRASIRILRAHTALCVEVALKEKVSTCFMLADPNDAFGISRSIIKPSKPVLIVLAFHPHTPLL